MPRPARPINVDQATIAVFRLIIGRVGQPCPTMAELSDWTGIQRREIWSFLESLVDRGLIEIERRGEGCGHAWRMRVINGGWTGWTQRRPPFEAVEPAVLEAGEKG